MTKIYSVRKNYKNSSDSFYFTDMEEWTKNADFNTNFTSKEFAEKMLKSAQEEIEKSDDVLATVCLEEFETA